MDLKSIPSMLTIEHSPVLSSQTQKMKKDQVKGVKLGEVANLTYGLRTDFDPSKSGSSPFYTPSEAPLKVFSPVAQSTKNAIWGFPNISLHTSTSDLLQEIFGYEVQAMHGNKNPFSISAAPLMIGDLNSAEEINNLNKKLGISIEKGYSYMLVEIVRKNGTDSHSYTAGTSKDPGDHLNEKAAAQVEMLMGVSCIPEGQLTADKAKEFLNCFSVIGTHYVSKVELGDKIYQVFSYEEKQFAELTRAFNKASKRAKTLTGIDALNFSYYTSILNDDTGVVHGYAKEQGTLNIASGDSKLNESVISGQWKDTARADFNSIFTSYSSNSTIDLEDFTEITSISAELTPIANLISVEKSAAGRMYWDRLFNGCMTQKYGNDVTISFATDSQKDWSDLIPNTGPWLSTIATPTVNVYDSHLELDTIQLTNRAAVNSFSSWSLIMESDEGTALIPGKDVFISSFLIDTTKASSTPVLELDSKEAHDNIRMACGEMQGALLISYKGGSEVRSLMDGIELNVQASKSYPKRNEVIVTGDLFGAQAFDNVGDHQTNINFSITACQALLNTRGKLRKSADLLASNCLKWIVSIIPNEETTSSDLMQIRTRAGYLAHVAGNLNEAGVPVPYLTYQSYQPYIQAMSTAANTLVDEMQSFDNKMSIQRNAELAATNAEQINENVKTSGAIIKGYIDAVAENQKDIADNYRNIITTKEQELTSALTKFSKLVSMVSDQKEVVSDAKLDFEFALRDYERMEIIKAVINISVAVFTVGMTFAVPATAISSVKVLGETAQKIQKLLTIMKNIMDLEKTIEGTVRNMVKVNQGLDAIKDMKLSMPSSREWSELDINFNASLAGVPGDLASYKAKLTAAFKILVLRGQAMINAQSKIVQIQAEIALTKAQMSINEAQEKRLNKIIENIHFGSTTKAPNLSEVDLLSLTGHVQSQLNQILSSLAGAIVIQDSAIQFELLAVPISVKKFDLASLQIVMASQQLNIINAKIAFNPPPSKVEDPIKVVVKGVPIKDLTDGNSYTFEIQPSESQFQPYNMVRIQKVVVDIPQIKSSAGGKYRVDLRCLANPFQDRNRIGETLVYNSVARNFGPFEYHADTHKPIFGKDVGSIGDSITKITPFSTWLVSIPALDVNKDIDFGNVAAVDIELSFDIEALAEPALHNAMISDNVSTKSLSHPKMLEMFKAIPATAQKSAMKMRGASETTPSNSSLDNMLTQMNKSGGVLKGWDCVLNMLEEPVNKFLAKQYHEKFPSAKPMVIEFGFCQSFKFGKDTGLTYTKFTANLGIPLLEFQANNHNYVSVVQQILSGDLQTGTIMIPGKGHKCPVPLDLDNPDIDWDEKEPIDVSSKPEVSGSVGLGMIQGLVQPILPDGSKGSKDDAHSVILDFTKSSFVANNLNINTDDAAFNTQLTNWFVSNPIQYIINTVVFNDASTLAALQPSMFKLNALTTNSKKNILQLFITTNGTQQDNLTINVNEPIPDGYENSLMINTKIMYQDIFVNSFNKGTTNLQVQAIDPGKDFDSYSAKVTAGTASGTATFQNTNRSETRIRQGSNTITWPLKGLTFSPTKDLGVALAYKISSDVAFQHRTWKCYGGGRGVPPTCYWGSWKDHKVNVTVSLTGNYPLEVSNAGGKQEVQIASLPPTVDVVPEVIKPTGPCECNDNDLRIMVGKVLHKQVPKKLEDSMAGIKFTSVSVFALYNLLFPAKDFIQMKDAFVPGDLVVLGTFANESTPST